jgi:glycosyltransferase involved in cell wall biosynthesis
VSRRKPPVTVVVTVYNRAPYLASSLASVLASRFEDFELLVLDNCSTDGSWEIAQDFARRDPRVRVVQNERNLGQFGNRNRVLELVETRLFKFHDSDDLLYPHGLETLYRCLEQAPTADLALSGGWAWEGGPCPMVLSPREAYRREYLGRGLFYCGPASALFKTESFRFVGGFEDHGAASDYLFWLRVCRTLTVALAPADLFWYRIHPNQEYASPAAAESYARAQAEGWKALFAPDCPLQGEDKEQARRNQAFGLAKHTWRDLKAGRFGLARLRLAEARFGWRDAWTYLRRQKRDAFAGTPRDADGEFLLPPWFKPEGPEAP